MSLTQDYARRSLASMRFSLAPGGCDWHMPCNPYHTAGFGSESQQPVIQNQISLPIHPSHTGHGVWLVASPSRTPCRHLFYSLFSARFHPLKPKTCVFHFALDSLQPCKTSTAPA